MSKKIRDKIIPVFFALIVISGLLLLFYPIVSDMINSKTQSKTIKTYTDTVENMPQAQYDEEFRKAEKYNEKVYKAEDALIHPEKIEGYNEVLNVNHNGLMGYVTIPKINVKLGIYHGTNDAVLQEAAGHLEGSSVPIGGPNTHAVIVGHRGMISASLFTELDKMEVGDQFSITIFDKVMIYTVDQIKTVLPEEDKPLKIVDGKDYVTLQTCTPYGVNSHRLLVRGIRTGTTTVEDEEFDVEPGLASAITNKRNFIPLVIAAAIILAGIIARIIINKKSKKNNETSDVSEQTDDPTEPIEKEREKEIISEETESNTNTE